MILIILSGFYMQEAFAALPYFSHMYFFGDSMTDAGNYIEKKPRVCVRVNAPVTNPTGGTQPATVWADDVNVGFVATPSRITQNNGQVGNDYAIAGSLSNNLKVEVNNYLTNNKSADPQALYVIWIGGNDIMERIYEHLQFRDTVINNGMRNIQNSIEQLYKAGARNFLVIGVPDISVAPLVANPHMNWALDTGIFHFLTKSIHISCTEWNKQLFNSSAAIANSNSLKAPLAALALKYTDIRIYTWDPIPFLDQAANNPSQFGFPNKINNLPNNYAGWCNGATTNSNNPDNYIFFNYIHPTARAHAILAQHIRDEADLFSLNG